MSPPQVLLWLLWLLLLLRPLLLALLLTPAPGMSPPQCSEFYTGWLTHWGESQVKNIYGPPPPAARARARVCVCVWIP